MCEKWTVTARLNFAILQIKFPDTAQKFPDAGTVAFQYIQKFPEEALEELGFTTCECTQVGELSAVLDGQPPDLTIAGLLPMTP